MTYTPAITQTTQTTDLINSIVDAVRDGARKFRLGRFTARWERNAWRVHDGCEDRLVMGGNIILPIAVIVRCWLADDWDL